MARKARQFSVVTPFMIFFTPMTHVRVQKLAREMVCNYAFHYINRAVLSEYTLQVREVASKLLNLIAEGLGLDKDYFCGDLSKGTTKMEVNYYPQCPDPSLTMGLLPHCDRQLITVLAQGTAACGLQAKYKERWINVKPIPNAFVVNFGHQLEVEFLNLLVQIYWFCVNYAI
jgi:isopenicillin N synthase-like dioxygenase